MIRKEVSVKLKKELKRPGPRMRLYLQLKVKTIYVNFKKRRMIYEDNIRKRKNSSTLPLNAT